MTKKSTSIKKKSTSKSAWSVKSDATKTMSRGACRDILTPTKKSTLGRARIKAAIAKVYGKKSA